MTAGSWLPPAILSLVLSVPAPLAHAADPCRSPAERALDQHGPFDLSVGYVDQPPLAWNDHGDPHDPVGIAVDVLGRLAGRHGWQLTFVATDLTDALDKTSHCKLDLAIVPPLPVAEEQRVDRTIPYFHSVAAVAIGAKPDAVAPGIGEDKALPERHSGMAGLWAACAVRVLFFGALAVAGLLLLVNLVNLRVPRIAGHRPERLRLVALDPGVSGARGAWRWLWSAPTGRVLALIWLASGIGVALASTPAGGSEDESDEAAAYVRALRQSLRESTTMGVRPGGRVVECRDVDRCTQDLTHGDLIALAGDSATLCHEVRTRGVAGVHLERDLLGPVEHAFLVPPAGPMRRLLNAWLAEAAAEEGDTGAMLRRKYGVPWTAPVLEPVCPGEEARR